MDQIGQEGEILVVKVGGSTLGSHDTALEDVVYLQKQGLRPVLVHGGGSLISDWLAKHNVPTRFQRGLRVTDAGTLEVVVAVLAGLVNKQMVAAIGALGGRAAGLSGVDGGFLRGRIVDADLGYVGEVTRVDASFLAGFLEGGLVPVVAPVAVLDSDGRLTAQLLNVNADIAAGAIAAALGARWLVFLTDVAGVRGRDGETVGELSGDEAQRLLSAGVVQGGMIPKVEACLAAARAGVSSVIADGRRSHALRDIVEGNVRGTLVKGV
jgi:acetylglutamate kinase